jgi:hypothetical protein
VSQARHSAYHAPHTSARYWAQIQHQHQHVPEAGEALPAANSIARVGCLPARLEADAAAVLELIAFHTLHVSGVSLSVHCVWFVCAATYLYNLPSLRS